MPEGLNLREVTGKSCACRMLRMGCERGWGLQCHRREGQQCQLARLDGGSRKDGASPSA